MSIVPTGGLSMLRNMAVSGLRTNGTPCMRTVCTVAAGVGVGVGFGFGLFGFPLSPPPPQLPSSADAATAAMTDQSLDDIRTITIRLRTTWGGGPVLSSPGPRQGAPSLSPEKRVMLPRNPSHFNTFLDATHWSR